MVNESRQNHGQHSTAVSRYLANDDNLPVNNRATRFFRDILRVFVVAFAAWIRDNVARQSAALAYYGILSLAPLLVISVNIAGLFLAQSEVEQEVLGEVEQTLGSGSVDLVRTVLDATYHNADGTLATTLSLFLILFAATNIFFQLKTSLNLIWDKQSNPDEQKWYAGILRVAIDRFVAAIMVIGFGLMFVLSQVLSTITSMLISLASNLPLNTVLALQLLNTVALIAFLALIISLIFRFLPDRELGWHDVRVGALFTAILFSVGQRVISVYLENNTVASAYGVAGSLILILLWIYYSFAILLFGAEFTQAYSRLYGSSSESSKSGQDTEIEA